MVQSAHNVFLLVAPTVRDRDAWAAAIAHQVGDEEHGKRTPISVGKSEVAHVLWSVRARAHVWLLIDDYMFLKLLGLGLVCLTLIL